MGEVYRARDPRLGRDVAVKVIAGEDLPDPGRLRRFEQETWAVAALRHPHILAVHDVGSDEGRPYVVFELLEKDIFAVDLEGRRRLLCRSEGDLSLLDVSPDGRALLQLFPLDGGPARDVGRVPADLRVRRWSGDGRSIFLANPVVDVACQLARFDLGTSRLEVLLRGVAPPDRAGVNNCNELIPSADGSAYASVHRRCLTDLVLVEGLR
jgi:hypothetical protein